MIAQALREDNGVQQNDSTMQNGDEETAVAGNGNGDVIPEDIEEGELDEASEAQGAVVGDQVQSKTAVSPSMRDTRCARLTRCIGSDCSASSEW